MNRVQQQLQVVRRSDGGNNGMCIHAHWYIFRPGAQQMLAAKVSLRTARNTHMLRGVRRATPTQIKYAHLRQHPHWHTLRRPLRPEAHVVDVPSGTGHALEVVGGADTNGDDHSPGVDALIVAASRNDPCAPLPPQFVQ